MDARDKIVGYISLLIVLIAGLGMTPTVIDQIETLQAQAVNWTFTGHDGAEALLGLIPFVWIASILVSVVVGAFLIAKSE